MGTRDKLAIKRTQMANERTFLSYARTSILFFVAGITLLKFQPNDKILAIVSVFLLIFSAATICLGAYLFRKNKREFITQ